MELLNNVLVVDDDPALLEQAEAILSPQYGVSLASSGEQALHFLEKGNRPNLILLDILMPGMDGYETLAAIRSVEGCGNIPVVYVTSLTGPDAEVKGLTSGAADFLTKPFVPQVLLTRVALRLRREYALNEERLAARSKDPAVFFAFFSPNRKTSNPGLLFLRERSCYTGREGTVSDGFQWAGLSPKGVMGWRNGQFPAF